MKLLFLGGTGIISTACTKLAVQRGHEVFLLNRGLSEGVPGARVLVGDIYDPVSAVAALQGHSWDAVVDFLCFNPQQLEQRLDLFRGRTGQYLFISSASAYQKPCASPFVTESTPLANPFWDYSRNKIACEDRLTRALREESFPMTIVRPSFTYGHTVFPLAINSWQCSYTVVDRMRRGLPVLVPGDGLGLWTLTHNSDFAVGLVGLLGHQGALGNAFHITSDEVLTWNDIVSTLATAAGVEADIVPVTSRAIAAALPEWGPGLIGDKSNSVIFDNSKIRSVVPGWHTTIPFWRGAQQIIDWHDADASRRVVDGELDARLDALLGG